MDNFGWDEVLKSFRVGDNVPYWRPKTKKVYSGRSFTLRRLSPNVFTVTIPSGKELDITRDDYEQTRILLKPYLNGEINRLDVQDKSWKSVYIFSVLHALMEATGRIAVLGDLLKGDSKIFLKPEFGPITSEWPAASFTKRGYADQLFEEIGPNDLVMFTGTSKAPTDREYRGRILSVGRLREDAPVPTSAVVPQYMLNAFEAADGARFGWSLVVSDALGY